MTRVPDPEDRPSRGTARGGPSGPVGRRSLLAGGGVGLAGLGAAAGAAITHRADRGSSVPSADEASAAALNGPRTVPFIGTHQAGIQTPAPAHITLLALDLEKKVDRDAVIRMLRLLTDDAARLTQGRAALADTEPELALNPANLTVTVGFGPGLFRAAGRKVSAGIGPLPAFSIDDLDPDLSGGDLAIQVCSDDPLVVAHTARMLTKDIRSFTRVRWQQSGFRRAHGSVKPGTTMRNTFGQVDGSANPALGSDEFAKTVWIDDGPLAGGTTMVVRLIHMDLDLWDKLDRSGREQSVGRKLTNGAPLTGTKEHDEPDFDQLSKAGFATIPEFSHMRRARGVDDKNGGQTIYRRSYNVDAGANGGALTLAADGGRGAVGKNGGEQGSPGGDGQLFIAFQADVEKQFVPIQKRLDELDLLNQWTVPVGSAVFAVPPGVQDGQYVGQTLLEG
jgi:dye decolorizing peroxidase